MGGITKGVKRNLEKYNINLPTDMRSKEYKAIVKQFKLKELYVLHLRTQIALANLEEVTQKKLDKKNETRERRALKKEKLSFVRHIGSVSVQYLYIDKNKYETVKNVIIPVDKEMNPANIQQQVKKIIDDDREDRFLKADYKAKIIDIIAIEFQHNLRPVEKGKKLDNIRMRLSGAGLIDGYEKQTWDTNTGRCVFDYIIHRYQHIKGFKNICTYGNLEAVFNNYSEDGEHKDLLSIGVNTNEIELFCMSYKIPMYAIDDNEKTFRQYTPPIPNKKCPAMIFRLSNKHFYPVINKSKIQSVTKTTSMINSVDSEMVRDTFKVKLEDLDDVNKIIDVEYVDDITKKLTQTIKDGMIPDKITMLKKELYGFKYEKQTFDQMKI